jgi:hypothetical protein
MQLQIVLEKYEAVFTEVPDSVEVMAWSSQTTAQLALKVADAMAARAV